MRSAKTVAELDARVARTKAIHASVARGLETVFAYERDARNGEPLSLYDRALWIQSVLAEDGFVIRAQRNAKI